MRTCRRPPRRPSARAASRARAAATAAAATTASTSALRASSGRRSRARSSSHVRLRLVIVALALAPAVAWAQAETWSAYPSSVYREGPGLRIGQAPIVFHPGIILEGGYDSNVFYSPAGQETGAGVLRIRAHLDIATLPPQRMEGDSGTADPKVDFRFSGQVEYRQYLSGSSDVLHPGQINLLG